MSALKRVFEGGDRSYMHEEIHRYFSEARNGVIEVKKTDYYDRMVVDLVREDPSLLTDPLSLNFGPPVWERKDGKGHWVATRTAGTWCMLAAAMPFPHTMELALKAGISADDSSVFMSGGLLSYRHWFKTPTLLELALKYGANPDAEVQHAQNQDKGSPAQVLRAGLQTSKSRKDVEKLADVRAIALLLQYGAKRVGHVDDESVPGALDYHASAAWLLARISTGDAGELKAALADLVPLLKANGLNIDSACMSRKTAPIVESVRARNRPMVEAFIASGARTDDEHIVQQALDGQPLVLPLHEEVERAFGAEGVAWLTESLMRHRIGDDDEAALAPPARRRMRVL